MSAIPKLAMFATGCMLLAACPAADDSVPVETNDLGITKIEIDHSYQNGEPLTTIRGLDDTGREIATATVLIGLVPNAGALFSGSLVTISSGGASQVFDAPNHIPYEIGEPVDHALAGFTRLHAVAAQIDADADLRFLQWDRTETAFNARLCAGTDFPTKIKQTDGSLANTGPVASCCIDGPYEFFKVNTGGATKPPPQDVMKLGQRYGGSAYGTPCHNQDGSAGGQNAFYGPSGFHSYGVTWVSGNTTNAVIFYPYTVPTYCGWDVDAFHYQGGPPNGTYNPEEYALNGQTIYSGVTPANANTECVNGVPHANLQTTQAWPAM